MAPLKQNQFVLLRQKRFLPFFVTQFLGAFNDNVFKNALIILIAFKAASNSDISPDLLTNLSAGLFILPFLLFSAIAGQLIEKYEKSRSIQRIKLLEVAIMLCAAVAFYINNIYMLIALLFLMGVQSTLFGPAKYSYIPQHMSDEELVGANALVQFGTFAAILIGTMCGGVLIASEAGKDAVAIAIIVLALCGYFSSRWIPLTPSHNSSLSINWNIFIEMANTVRLIRRDGKVFVCVIGISWFWFLGATYLVQLPSYTRQILGADEQVVTLLLTMFTIGIGVGALLCNRLADKSLNIKLVALSSLGITLFGVDLFFAAKITDTELFGLSDYLSLVGSYRIIVDVLCIGVFGGLYIVPLFTYVQRKIDPSQLSRVIAGNNILNAIFMVMSALMAMFVLGNDVSIDVLLLLVSLLNVVFGIAIVFFMKKLGA